MRQFYVPYIKSEEDKLKIETVKDLYKKNLEPEVEYEINSFKGEMKNFTKFKRAGFTKQTFLLSK